MSNLFATFMVFVYRAVAGTLRFAVLRLAVLRLAVLTRGSRTTEPDPQDPTELKLDGFCGSQK